MQRADAERVQALLLAHVDVDRAELRPSYPKRVGADTFDVAFHDTADDRWWLATSERAARNHLASKDGTRS